MGHWDAWEDDAIVVDQATGLFAHPDKVHRLDYEGELLPLARAVHGAALGAGPSGDHPGGAERARPALRGALGGAGVRRLSRAGRGRADYAAFKQEVAAAGRDPDQVQSRPACYPVVAETPGGGGGQGGADRQAAAG